MNASIVFDCPLHTFHHLAYDRLMPWLPENQESVLYGLLLTDLSVNNKPFFALLVEAMHNRKVLLDTRLLEEWQLFAQMHVDGRARELYMSMYHLKASHQKIAYYSLLIFNAWLYSESALVELMKVSSTPLKHYNINKWLKTIQDLRGRLRQLYQERAMKEMVVIYLTDMALLLLEGEIQTLFTDYCPIASLRSSSGSLIITPEIMGEDWLLAEATDDWFTNVYLKRYKNTEEKKPYEKEEKDHLYPIDTTGSFMTGEGIIHSTNKGSDTPPARKKEDAPPTPSSDMINSRQVMELLGIGKTKLFDMRKKKEIPFVRMGKLIRYSRQDIMSLRDQFTSKRMENDNNDTLPL